jgi:hypothetical protein
MRRKAQITVTQKTKKEVQKSAIAAIKKAAPIGSIISGEAIPLPGNTSRLIALSAKKPDGTHSDQADTNRLTTATAQLFGYKLKTQKKGDDLKIYMEINGVGLDVVLYLIDRLNREVYETPIALLYDLDQMREGQ